MLWSLLQWLPRHGQTPTRPYQPLRGQRGQIWLLVELLLGEGGRGDLLMGQCQAVGIQTGEDQRSFHHSDLWGEERQQMR